MDPDDPADANDPQLSSWLPVPVDSEFPMQNLPFGVVRPRGGGRAGIGVAIGDHVLDLAAAHLAGLFDGVAELPIRAFEAPTLNTFLALGPDVWRATRRRVSRLLSRADDESRVRAVLWRRDAVETLLPFEVGDFVDFYSSVHHATNLGRILRPDGEPLAPNWRQLPVGYHGRAGTVVVSGTPIFRPRGLVPGDDRLPVLTATRELDFELEVGFVIGAGNERHRSIRVDDADQHVFGVVLLNDWSARDIQSYEYQPLGPFLGKSFATTISPWIVTLDALGPFLVPPPRQDPAPASYLRGRRPWAIDLMLDVELGGHRVCHTNFCHQYWTFAQQLAHLTINGATTRAGDLYASGAVSGPGPEERASLIELTWRGRDPLVLPDGTCRRFLEDGDTVTLRAAAGGRGRPRIGFGDATGTIVAAREV